MRIPVMMRSSKDERGATAILVSATALALFGVLAFVVDFGVAYGHQRSLQNAADAAVLAAGGVVLEESQAGDSCDEMIGRVGVLSAAQVAATSAFDHNAPPDSELLTDEVQVTCDDALFPNRVVITADAVLDQPAVFGAVMGASQYQLGKPAKSMIGPSAELYGLRPFGLCEALADLEETDPDAYLTIIFSNQNQGCGTADGMFGTLDFNTWSSTPPSGPLGPCPGVSEVRPWIEYGFDGAVPTTSPIFVHGDPGTPSQNYRSEFFAILDEPIVLPRYVERTGSGCSTSVYEVTGFVEVKLCGYQLSNNEGHQDEGVCFQPADAPANGPFVQVQFERFIPIGSLSLTCELAATCDSGTPLLKLAD